MMHADQVEITAPLVRGLLDRQLPQYAGLPLAPVAEHSVPAFARRGLRTVAAVLDDLRL